MTTDSPNVHPAGAACTSPMAGPAGDLTETRLFHLADVLTAGGEQR